MTHGSGKVKGSEGSLILSEASDASSADLVLHSDVSLARVDQKLHHRSIAEEGGEVKRRVPILQSPHESRGGEGG